MPIAGYRPAQIAHRAVERGWPASAIVAFVGWPDAGSVAVRADRPGIAACGSGMMADTAWHGAVIARGDDIVIVEGNHHFPRDAVDPAVPRPSGTVGMCPWKGVAHYRTLVVDGAEHRGAAWCYRRRRKSGIASPSGRA